MMIPTTALAMVPAGHDNHAMVWVTDANGVPVEPRYCTTCSVFFSR